MRIPSSLLLLLPSVAAAAGRGLGPFDSPPIDGSIADPEDPTEPVVNYITNKLVVSYSSVEGLSNIAAHVEESKLKGRSVTIREEVGQRYKKKVKNVKKGGRIKKNKGNTGGASKEGKKKEKPEKGKKDNKGKKDKKGKKGNKRRGRFLQSEDEEETAGYTILDVGSEVEAEAEMYELIGISGELLTSINRSISYFNL